MNTISGQSGTGDARASRGATRSGARRRPGGGATVKGRLSRLIIVIGILWLATVGVAANGLLSARTKSAQAAADFTTFQLERNTYEGWLTDDDQSNMFAGLALLRDARHEGLMTATWQQVVQGRAQAESGLAALSGRVPAALRPSLARLRSDLAAYGVFTDRVHARVTAGDPAGAELAVAVSNATVSNQLQSDFDRLSSALAAMTTAIKSEVASQVSRSVLLLIVIALVSIALAAVQTARVIRSLVRRLGDLVTGARRIADEDVDTLARGLVALADGDLTYQASATVPPIEVDGADEIAEVAAAVERVRARTTASLDSYNAMAARLRDLIGEVSGSAGQVNDASQYVAASSQEAGVAVHEIAEAMGDVARGADRQQQMVRTASRTAATVAEAVNESAASAHEAAEVAAQAQQTAGEGVRAAQAASRAMHEMRDANRSITGAIDDLARKSDEIGMIVRTITNIADQTNLLALNAAIEAARAGDSGRGFAVVAEEVRKLAEESQAAAGEIATLIEQIQGETGRVVEVVEDGTRRTEEGAETVERAREAFEQIGDAIGDVSTRVQRIAASAQHVAAESAEMQQSIAEVASVAEQSSAASEEVSASSEQTSASTQEISLVRSSAGGVRRVAVMRPGQEGREPPR